MAPPSTWYKVLAHVGKFLTIQDCAKLAGCRRGLRHFFIQIQSIGLDCDDFESPEKASAAVAMCPLLRNLHSIRHVRYRGLREPLLSSADIWKLIAANKDTLKSIQIEGHVLRPLVTSLPCHVGAPKIFFTRRRPTVAHTGASEPRTVPNLVDEALELGVLTHFTWVVFDCPLDSNLPGDLCLPSVLRVKLRGHLWRQQRLLQVPPSPSDVSHTRKREHDVTFDIVCWSVKTLRLHGTAILPIKTTFREVVVARVDGLLELLTLTCRDALERQLTNCMQPVMSPGLVVMPPKLNQQERLIYDLLFSMEPGSRSCKVIRAERNGKDVCLREEFLLHHLGCIICPDLSPALGRAAVMTLLSEWAERLFTFDSAGYLLPKSAGIAAYPLIGPNARTCPNCLKTAEFCRLQCEWSIVLIGGAEDEEKLI